MRLDGFVQGEVPDRNQCLNCEQVEIKGNGPIVSSHIYSDFIFMGV